MLSKVCYSTFAILAASSPQPNPPEWPHTVTVFDADEVGDALLSKVQKPITDVYELNGGPEEHGQFSSHRHAFLFKPGTYNVEVPIGYYTQALGLGEKPDDVVFTSPRGVFSEEANINAAPGALDTFWRGAENFRTRAHFPWINGQGQGMLWAASQASPLRRVKVDNDLWLFEYIPPYSMAGEASGGFLGNSEIGGKVMAGGQQQYLTRNTKITGTYDNGVWNMVFVGCDGPTNRQSTNCINSPMPNLLHHVVVDETPVIAEKPFISIKKNGKYKLNIPRLLKNQKGPSFHKEHDQVDFKHVYVARADKDTGASINAQLKDGMHVVFSPGIYNLVEALEVNHEGQVLLGLGLATLVAAGTQPTIRVGNVDNVRVAGLLLEAGSEITESLLTWGSKGYAGNENKPGVATDIFARAGGPPHPVVSQTKTFITINSGNVILDNSWLWRADHTATGLIKDGENPVDVGAVINGDHFTAYGFKVEHASTDQVQWNGNHGATYMFQAEMPYGVTQADFGDKGYTGYRVAENVTSHKGYGVGVYHYFRDNEVTVESGIVAPDSLVSSFVAPLAVRLNGMGKVKHIINELGEETKEDPNMPGNAIAKWLCQSNELEELPAEVPSSMSSELIFGFLAVGAAVTGIFVHRHRLSKQRTIVGRQSLLG